MQNSLFRKVALERLSSPEQLDRMMTVTSLKGWIALAAAIFLISTFIVWSFLGTISTRVVGQGILLKSMGVYNISHSADGRIYDIKVVPGDMVKKGEIIARIDRDDIAGQINDLKHQLDMLNKEQSPASEQGNRDKESILENIQKLQYKLEAESCIISPYSGRVLEIKINKWDAVSPGIPIMSIEPTGSGIKELEGFLFVPAQEGDKIMPGMEVFLAPASVKKEDFGYMLGRVVAVSDYPVTYQGMVNTLGSKEIADIFSRSGPMVQVSVDIITARETPSGYKWANSKGPSMKINSGTLFTGQVAVSKQKPVKMIFPIN